MKKKLLLVLITAILALSAVALVGCGDNQYTVSFNTNGGSVVASQTVNKGDKATKPSDPTKTGYSFDGWYYQDEEWSFIGYVVTSNMELTAKWTANTYTVTFDSDGGSAVDNMTATYDQEFTLPTAPTKAGYTFAGWFENVTEYEGGLWQRDSGLALKAKWTAKTYTVTFDSDGGSEVENTTVTYNKEFTLPTSIPQKLGSDFVCWKYGNSIINNGDICAIDSNESMITLTAQYSAKEEMSNFYFTSTTTTCEITGLKNKSATSITMPNYVTSIGYEAFDGCSSLMSVTIPNSVTSIGKYAFGGCYGLTKVNYTGTIDDWVQIEFGSDDANPIYWAENLYINDTLVTNANITTATKINDYAFAYCSSLTSITIGNSVTSIESYAFAYCSSLESVIFEEDSMLTSIGSGAFYNCDSLESVTIGNSVTSIGSYAFEYCTSLTIYCEVASKPSGWHSDWNVSNCPVVWDYKNN